MNDKPPSAVMNDPFEAPKRMKQFVIYDRLTALIPTAPTVGYSKDTNNTYVLISISYYYNKLRRLSLLFYLKKVYWSLFINLTYFGLFFCIICIDEKCILLTTNKFY